MAVLSKEEYMNRLKERIGEDTSDEAMSFLEDMTDTFNDFETKSSGVNDEQWQTKLDELDKSWREKYKARFFNSESTPDEAKRDQEKDVKKDSSEKNYEDLFEEREG